MLEALSFDSTLSEELLKGDENDETDEPEPSDSGEARCCLSLSAGLYTLFKISMLNLRSFVFLMLELLLKLSFELLFVWFTKNVFSVVKG